MASGRKKYEINWETVNKYLRAHCDGASVARLLGMHPNTLYQATEKEFNCNFSDYAQQKRAEGVSIVEYSIYMDAIKKGGTDRIFWLKNKANWADKTVVDANINIPELPKITIRTNET